MRQNKNLIHQIATPLTNCLLLLENYLEKTWCKDKGLLLAKQELRQVFSLLNNREAKNWQKANFSPHQVIKKFLLTYQKPYQVDCCLQATTETIIFHGQEQLFVEILTHLLNNASEAYPSTQTKRPISIVLTEARKGLTLIVGDNGKGITSWQKFQLAFCRCSFKEVKSGLGLARIKFLLKTEFAGDLKILSWPQQGTLMIVHFPLR